ncbi:hypothetical protein LZZ85_06385 [Terrimonas sp. NA20]|uniref:Uncharacterized protein n=1 Tax=Terrimonas ginsenosidimutans TaxID=2908004 RepID=A0ABS9KNN7_9BACT|nr:hypothetical protein [Terrimonas ginsenosidimutans]MCG2613899.1 hypothetical protein [Terrimonas ginsenosidimutans]
MKKAVSTYQLRHYITSITMLLMMVWLTVSTPFVFASQSKAAYQQALSAASSQSTDDSTADDEQACTPLGGTEEKTSNGVNSISEEYLHMDSELFHLAELSLNHTPQHTISEYVAFHGELLCPPPNCIG